MKNVIEFPLSKVCSNDMILQCQFSLVKSRTGKYYVTNVKNENLFIFLQVLESL